MGHGVGRQEETRKTSGKIKECRVEMVGVRAEKEGDTAGFQHILFSNKI